MEKFAFFCVGTVLLMHASNAQLVAMPIILQQGMMAQTGSTAAPTKFDFGSTSVVQSGFTGVDASKTYSAGLKYGFTTSPYSNADRAVGNNLVRDLVWGWNNTFDFRVDVPNGSYTVVSIAGDSYQANGLQTFQVVLGTGTTQSINMAQSVWYRVAQDVTVTGGAIGMRYGPAASTYPVLSGIVVCAWPKGTLTVNAPGGSLAADGSTIDTFTGSGASANAMLSISTLYGTITTADGDSYFEKYQVTADASGNFSVNIRRPPYGGDLNTISVVETMGCKEGSLSFTYAGSPQSEWKYDIGATSNVHSGFTGIAAPAYNDTNGYGFSTLPYSTADRGVGDNLVRDFVWGYGGNFAFKVKLSASTTYTILSIAGDNYSATGNQTFTVLQGTGSNTTVNIPASVWARVSQDVTSTSNGYIEMQYGPAGSGYPVLSGFIVCRQPRSALTLNVPSNPAANGTTVDTITGSGAASGDLINVSSTRGTVTSTDADSYHQNKQVTADASGNFSFTIQRPATAGLSTVTAEVTKGCPIGTSSVNYQ